MTLPFQPDADGRPCSHCGRKLVSYSGGYRTVMLGGVMRRLCRGDDPAVVDCYESVMVGGVPVGTGKGRG
jgi:hypothetical protein